jgi:diguanylate cyclase (GGDEF)-like protein
VHRHEPPPDAAVWAAIGRGLATHPDDGVVVMRPMRDAEGDVVDFLHEWINEAGERNAGRPLLGLGLIEAYGPDSASLFDLLRALLGTGSTHRMVQGFGTDTLDDYLHRRTFDIFLVDVDGDRVVCQYRDISDLERARLLLEHQARHDELTGIANRRKLREHLDEVLSLLPHSGRSVLLMLADLDRFKRVNDDHGHAVGDQLLREAAERMRASTRSTDLVTRYGGDEFVVVCHDVHDEIEAQAFAERLRSAVAGRYVLDGDIEVDVGLSIGLALTDVPLPAQELLERADRALYAVKTAAGSGH